MVAVGAKYTQYLEPRSGRENIVPPDHYSTSSEPNNLRLRGQSPWDGRTWAPSGDPVLSVRAQRLALPGTSCL